MIAKLEKAIDDYAAFIIEHEKSINDHGPIIKQNEKNIDQHLRMIDKLRKGQTLGTKRLGGKD